MTWPGEGRVGEGGRGPEEEGGQGEQTEIPCYMGLLGGGKEADQVCVCESVCARIFLYVCMCLQQSRGEGGRGGRRGRN